MQPPGSADGPPRAPRSGARGAPAPSPPRAPSLRRRRRAEPRSVAVGGPLIHPRHHGDDERAGLLGGHAPACLRLALRRPRFFVLRPDAEEEVSRRHRGDARDEDMARLLRHEPRQRRHEHVTVQRGTTAKADSRVDRRAHGGAAWAALGPPSLAPRAPMPRSHRRRRPPRRPAPRLRRWAPPPRP